MAVSPQQQWSALRDQIIHEEAAVAKYRTDVMNFTGAAANAQTEAEAANIRVMALRETAKLLLDDFRHRGLKFVDDEWVNPKETK